MADEKRLIDANDALKRLRKAEKQMCVVSACGFKAVDIDMVIQFVENRPTVDAVELPPIKVGDTAYFIINRKIYKAEVYYIRWEHHKRYGIHSEISANVGQYSSVGASFDDFGKTVFLTKEEAEAGLAKMDGGNEDG